MKATRLQLECPVCKDEVSGEIRTHFMVSHTKQELVNLLVTYTEEIHEPDFTVR